MKILGFPVFEDWRFPRLVSHVFDSDNKTETLGFLIFFAASYGAFIAKETDGLRVVHAITADQWMWMAALSSALVGTDVAFAAVIKIMGMRFNGAAGQQPPAAAPASEKKPDAAA